MFFRYLTPLIVIVILGLATVYFLFHKQHLYDVDFIDSYRQYESSKDDLPPGIRKDGQKSVADPRSYRDEWRSERDLIVQREMAEWAFFMLITAAVSLVITTIGVYYVALTFRETRRMVEEAAKGTKAAITAAEAAEYSSSIAQDTAKRQLRAYVSIEVDDQKDPIIRMEGIRIWLKAVNRGQTPACGFRHHTNVFIGDFPLPNGLLLREKNKTLRPSQGEIGVSMERPFPVEYRNQITLDEKQDLISGNKRIFIYGVAIYWDAFKEKHHIRYCYTVPLNAQFRPLGLEVYTKYNRSS